MVKLSGPCSGVRDNGSDTYIYPDKQVMYACLVKINSSDRLIENSIMCS